MKKTHSIIFSVFIVSAALGSSCFGQNHNNTVKIRSDYLTRKEAIRKASNELVKQDFNIESATDSSLIIEKGRNFTTLYFDTIKGENNLLLSDDEPIVTNNYFLSNLATKIGEGDLASQFLPQSQNANAQTEEIRMLNDIESSVHVTETIIVIEAILAVVGVILVLK
jgi:uncharacterized membrane protein YcgQ (UPF0703/DUF1980 family)